MGLFRLLPLIFVIATPIASRTPLCLQPFQLTSDTRSTLNCLCPVGSPTIIDSLDHDHQGVERLVIFFYRKPGTGQIIRFIPKKELQHRIPDFPEQYGTVKDISDHPSFKNMFENSPSKDIRDNLSNDHEYHPETLSNKEPSHVVILVDGKPRDLNIPENNPNEFHGNSEFPPWLIPVDKDSGDHIPHIEVKPYPEGSENNSPHIEAESNPHHVPNSNEYAGTDVPNDNNEHGEYNPEHSSSEDHPIDVTKEENDKTDEEDTDKSSVENENPLDYESSSHEHPSPNSETPEGNNESYPSSSENEANENVDVNTSGPFNPDIDIDSPQNSSENPQTPENLDNDGQDDSFSNVAPTEKKLIVPQKDHNGRIVGWTTKTIKTYWESNEHPHHSIKIHPFPHKELAESLSHNDMNENYEKIPSFDYWLKRQLNITTINGNRIPTSSDDITALHTEIRNVLLQNGLIVTRHGTLIDGHGKESKLDNLKLRPILIGKSISYNRFLKHIDSDVKFKIPSNTPFLEGLLLTMVKPANILGIVPLAITSLPEKHAPEHEKEDTTINGHAQTVDKKALLKILPISQVVAFRKHSQGKMARLTGSQRLGPKGTWIQHLGPKVALIRQRLGPKLALISRNNQHKEDSKHRQAVSKKAEKESDYWARWKYYGKPTKQRTNEEVPDFRIIGGISATVSGTPLLNRGRSGYAPLTHPLS